MTEFLVLVVVLLLATAFGLWRRATDGRMANVPAGPPAAAAQPSTALPESDQVRPTGHNAARSDRAGAAHQAPAGEVPVGLGQPIAADDRPPGHGGQSPQPATPVLGPDDLGQPLGERATLVQFSSAFCTPCRATRVVLAEVAVMVPGVVHVEVDAEARLELVRRVDVTRTPTVLVLDSDGRIRSRATGAPRKADVIAALGQVV